MRKYNKYIGSFSIFFLWAETDQVLWSQFGRIGRGSRAFKLFDRQDSHSLDGLDVDQDLPKFRLIPAFGNQRLPLFTDFCA
jgi:hypothetical protein